MPKVSRASKSASKLGSKKAPVVSEAVSPLKPFPKPLSLRKLIGPSFIILAFGLGSGELILWPYLTANHGLGLLWAALLGISFQYFIDMEIERYALVKGESVFVGLAKYLRWAPYWFIASTFIGFALPGIIAAAAQTLAAAAGINDFKWLAIGLLILLGLVLSLGKTVYSMMEHLTKTLILVGVPFIVILVLVLVDKEALMAAGAGLFGYGPGYRFLPEGISLATFLGAFAYSGAAGNLNLAQSIYVREKGYGMGAHAQKIAGLFKAGALEQKIKLDGEDFAPTPANIRNFKGWWRRISWEHGIVFWALGFFSMAVVMILAYVSSYGSNGNEQGIYFVINQSTRVGIIIAPWAGAVLLAVIGVLLTQTQLGILDSTSRMIAENIAIKKLENRGRIPEGKKINLTKLYYIFVWAQIVFGVILFLFDFYEPRTLIVAGALINAWAMTVHIALVAYLNWKALPKACQPPLWRRLLLLLIFLFFLGFGTITIWNYIV